MTTNQPKNFVHLIADLSGVLSEAQLKAHFGLYQGYVKKLAEITEKLATAPREANYSLSDYSELKRREPVAFNGTVLHELYFANLGPAGEQPGAKFKGAVESSFGSWDAYLTDCKAAVASGHGWLLTVFDWNYMVVRNNLVQSEHHVGLFPNCSVLFAVDAWEHAYFLDYGTKKADYVSGLLGRVRWSAVDERMAMTPVAK